MVKIGGRTVGFCTVWTPFMAPSNDTLEKIAAEVAADATVLNRKITGTAYEALQALERDSAKAALAARQDLSISKDFENMQRRLRSVEAPSLAASLRDLESPAIKAAREIALSQSHITEAARSAIQLEAAKMSALQASPANHFMEKIKAIESLGITKRFSEMQATLGASLSNKLLEVSRSVVDQWSATLRQSQELMRKQMADVGNSAQVEFARIAKLQMAIDRDVFKSLSTINAVNKDLFKPFTALEGAFRNTLSERVR